MKNTTLKMMMIAITWLFLVSLNSVADSLIYFERHPERYTIHYKDTNHCVSIIEADAGWRHEHYAVNNCGFDITLFYCSPDIEEEEFYDGNRRHITKCDTDGVHFTQSRQVSTIQPGVVEPRPIGVDARFSLEWFACGANGIDFSFAASSWDIKGNTPYSNKFSCYSNIDWVRKRNEY